MQVAALSVGPEHNTHFDNLFKVSMNMLVSIIPQNTDIGKAYESATSAEDQDFVQNLALFLTAFFKVQPSYAWWLCGGWQHWCCQTNYCVRDDLIQELFSTSMTVAPSQFSSLDYIPIVISRLLWAGANLGLPGSHPFLVPFLDSSTVKPACNKPWLGRG